MPCWTVRTTSIDLAKLDHELLAKTFESLGAKIRVDALMSGPVWHLQGGGIVARFYPGLGKLIVEGGTLTEQQVRQAYGKAAIKVAAERFGWKVKSGQKANQYVLSRRK